jgi:Fe-S cluster assembly iron-binding protein IscA
VLTLTDLAKPERDIYPEHRPAGCVRGFAGYPRNLLPDDKRKEPHMLLLTETAAEVVKSVTATPQAPDGAGLRISSSAPQPDNPGSLELTAAAGPGENDQVIEAAGARVFLEPQAALFLEDKVLDAQVDDQGNARFALGVQPPAQA